MDIAIIRNSNLNKEKYEFSLDVPLPQAATEARKRIEEATANFRNLSPLTLVKKATLIHRDKLDLLIDLGGFSRGHNAKLLALRPAPVQAHYLGYASTMGKGLVDYMIADATVIPPSSSKFYGEKRRNTRLKSETDAISHRKTVRIFNLSLEAVEI